MSLEAYALCRPNPAAISAGTTPLETYYTGADITFHMPYPLFAWLPLLPPHWIHALVGLLAIAGLTMALGLWYRPSAAIVFLTWGYLWVVESTRTYWQSHYYLEALLAFLMIWMPAARRYSVDAWLARDKQPLLRTVPFWTILLLRGQLLLAYFYAGVAKLSADWLLDAAPIRWVLADPAITTRYAQFLSASQLEFVRGILHSSNFAHFICWTGMFLDLAVGFLLLARRTRLFGLVLMVVFHATNHFILFDDIGWFPLVGVTTALIFLNPDWPERFGRWLKRPRLAKPDWAWFNAGAVLLPILGAALGWKAKATDAPLEPKEPFRLSRWTIGFVVVWLVWQAVMPLRHYAIAGNGRFTYEGMSFSWRLKAEARHAQGHQLFIQDATIIPPPNSGARRINWSEWHGDKVVYRRLTPGRIHWSQLPEFIVLLEPLFGERILYNAAAAPGVRAEAAIRDRIGTIWQGLYGRPPAASRPCETLSRVLDSAAASLRAAGREPVATQAATLALRLGQIERGELAPPEAMKTIRAVRPMLAELHARDLPPSTLAVLRTLEPFAVEGTVPGAGTLFVIEDAALFDATGGHPGRVNRKAWKGGAFSRSPRRPSDGYLGDQALVVYVGDIGIQSKELLPQVCIFDSEDYPEQPPFLWWNSPKELSFSKGLHLSVQAFLLRRYAQRVAALWEKEYGRRPIVNAATAVSLNGRPPQALVDPGVDLATVPVSYWRHNSWINDLELRRIPREVLAEGSKRPPGFQQRMQ